MTPIPKFSTTLAMKARQTYRTAGESMWIMRTGISGPTRTVAQLASATTSYRQLELYSPGKSHFSVLGP